jgi:hypothetical protein
MISFPMTTFPDGLNEVAREIEELLTVNAEESSAELRYSVVLMYFPRD